MRDSPLVGYPPKRPVVNEYVAERGLVNASRLRESLHGVRWDEHKMPWRLHRCWRQTRIVSRNRVVYRCACGGYSPDGVHWINKNSRRRFRPLRWLFQ